MYSNCLIEAIKARIKNDKVRIHLIPPSVNKSRFHFYWTDGEKIYHFTNKKLKKTSLWFDGETFIYDKRIFEPIILGRMKNSEWSIEKIARYSKKMGFSLTTPSEIKKYFDDESSLD